MNSSTTDFEVLKATAILNEAKNQDIIDDELPMLPKDRIKLAKLIVKQARHARSKGENGPHVTSILFAADVEPYPIPSSAPHAPKDHDDELALDDDEFQYKNLVSSKVEKGLPIPPEIEGDPPILPLDLTKISDREVMYLHGAFNACSARVNWLYSLEEAGQGAAGQIAEHLEEEFISELGEGRKDYGGKPKTQAQLKAEARKARPDIIKWRKRESKHAIRANKYKRLRDSYDNNCERLSRDWTMRTKERERS